MAESSSSTTSVSGPERPRTLPNLLLTPDPFGLETPSPLDSSGPRHVLGLLKNGNTRLAEILRQAVTQELSKMGVDYEFVRNKNKTRKSPRPKDHLHQKENGLNRMVEVELSCGTTVSVPLIIKETCDFIRKHIKQEGIFRKSGVQSRATQIMQRFTNPEFEDFFIVADTLPDVATVLKQYLREVKPLIPHSVQHVFIQCLELEPESVRNDALVLATCIIPPELIGCLTYILQFLAQVAESSAENLMTFENLAIIMGLNIMPMEERKVTDKAKDVQKTERQNLDLRNKIVEILMKNADRVGQITLEVEKRLDSLLTLRSSEDELENEGVGRRKKRRSGSLNSKSNRMLGFLKKVTSGKTGAETPITPMPNTPGDSFSYTPVIKGSSKKYMDDGVFSIHKKRTIFDRKNKSDLGTPTLPSQMTIPSPAICLNPSPMRADWKQTPSTNRLKNFVTPGLLRRRVKSGDEAEKHVFSVPEKQLKSKIRFGRSKTKKHETQQPEVKSRPTSASTMSIHKLAQSPRAGTLQRNNPSSSKIPRPDKPAVPPKTFSSSSIKLRSQSSKSSIASEKEGVYVAITAGASVDDKDIRNEAFIASSISVLTESSDTESSVVKQKQQENNLNTTTETNDTTLEMPPQIPLKLTPLIQEIESLTRTALEDLTLSTMKEKSASSIRSGKSRTLPESPTELDTTPLSTEQVETKFIKAMNETKMMKIRSDNSVKQFAVTPNLQRHMSVQVRGNNHRVTMSPSQRRISSARRRTHEIGRITPIVTPTRFLSLRSPIKKSTSTSPSKASSSTATLKRSPNRCTLKRGRPNTTRVGLARPSPARNTPKSVTTPSSEDKHNKKSVENETFESPPPPLPPRNTTTPMRRMSSVQELVHKLETKKKEKVEEKESNVDEPKDEEKKVEKKDASPNIIITRSKTELKTPITPSLHLTLANLAVAENNQEVKWVAGHQFKFDRKDFRGVQKSSDRDSIHFLKTLRAGKVPATVEYFNKIGHDRSPGKSLIPRYTALHNKDGSKLSLNSTTPEKASPLLNKDGITLNQSPSLANTTPNRLSRRMSSVDIDIRNKHEELLENIKKERAVKRSATTVGSYPHARRNVAALPPSRSSSNIRRPTTLDLSKTNNKKTTATPSPKVIVTNSVNSRSTTTVVARVQSFRRVNNPQTPRIVEEDESGLSLVVPDSKVVKERINSATSKQAITQNSPLKPSNVANLPRRNSMKKSPAVIISPPLKKGNNNPYNTRRNTNITINRTASENGTKSTTPRAAPRIKKSLTTRAYDMMQSNTPIKTIKTPIVAPSSCIMPCPASVLSSVKVTTTTTSSSLTIVDASLLNSNHAHTCQTITPRRRVPRMGHGSCMIPNSENNGNKTRTPLRATHIFTPSR